VLDAVPRAVIVTDPEGRVLLWNSSAEQLYGWTEPETLGRPLVEVLLPLEDREVGAAEIERLAAGATAHDDQFLVTKDGRPLWVQASAQPLVLDSGEVIGIVGVSHDVTELRLAQQAVEDLARHLSLVLEAGRMGTWRWDRASGLIEWDAPHEALYGLAPGTFGGRLDDYVALIHPDDRQATVESFTRAVEQAQDYQLRHRIVWPDGSVRWMAAAGKVLVDGRGAVTGALGCSGDVTDRMERELAVRQAVEGALQSASEERRRSEQLEFLASINEVLNECPDRASIMRRVTQAAVPRLGDWCALYVVEDPAQPPVVEVAHADPTLAGLARQLQAAMPWDLAKARGVARVIRTGRPALFPEIDDALLAGWTPAPDSAVDLVRRLALRSAVMVPLARHDQVFGAMLFVLGEGERRYGPEDLTLAQALAGRVASSLENRRLGAEQRHIAQTLQRSLLPDHLPHLEGTQMAVRYWAAGEASEVGGDFYDVFELDDQRFALVVGDVCGSGPQAAAVTALARHTIRANAWRGDGPGEILDHLNTALARTWPDTFCTVAYAEGRRVAEGLELVTVSGGHPLPLVVHPDGAWSTLGRPGLLIGAFEEVTHHVATTVLWPGDTVLFYTDGATDLPPPAGLDPDEFAQMAAAAVSGTAGPEEAAEALAAALERRRAFVEREDDVALLVVRVTA